VVQREDGQPCELTPEEEAELLESSTVMERGGFISGNQFLEQVRRFG
jgi:hypothetical protein